MKVRIKFRKYGPVRFIGHLDVMRYFQKAIRRAEIDITYTGGFSPHQIMTFAAPLGVGIVSDGEYMDIQINALPKGENGLTACETMVKRLNAVGVRGLDAVSARILPENAGNAMASVAAASYTVRFREGKRPQDWNDAAAQRLIDSFLSQGEILVEKQTKNGVRTVDLRPGIYELSWRNDSFFLLVDASSGNNIKPALLMETLLRHGGMTLEEHALAVARQDIFTKTVRETGEETFVSLGEIGFEEPFAQAEQERTP